MRTLTDKGTYTRKSGEVVSFDYSFAVLEPADISVEVTSNEAQQYLAGKKLAPIDIINQTLKEDARNNASGEAKRANGDVTVRVLSPEEKAQRKAIEAVKREIIAGILAGTITADEAREKLEAIKG